MAENNSTIDKFYFDCQTKDAASEFKEDILTAGVPADSMKLRKVPKTDIYRLTVTNENDEIRKVIDMLLGKEYGMSLEEIQDFLKIKFVLPEEPNTIASQVPDSLSEDGDDKPVATVVV